MRRALPVCVALFCAACGSGAPGLGNRVTYNMSEAMVLTGTAGSCLSVLHEDYVPEVHRHLRYAVGSLLGADVYWPDRNDCRDFFPQQANCQNIDPHVLTLGGWAPRMLSSSDGRPPTVTIHVSMTAESSAVLGGFRVTVNGKEFAPFFQLTTTDEYSGIWFEKTTCAGTNDCIIPGFVSEVRLHPGEPTAVAATLRTDSGEHICGTVPTSYTVDPPGLFSVEPWNLANYSNMPYRLVAGASQGSGTFQIKTVSGKSVQGTLRIIIE